MEFAAFRARIMSLVNKAGDGVLVTFSSEGGKFVAHCSNGVTITGNSTCPSMTVRWGSGHVAMAHA